MLSNELRHATSPYLLQHAYNPVHWQLWSADTLALAARLDRPILLSIGYAACHWCHVMAHESFEDPAVAALMNSGFVNVKVDREERPDIDHIYMTALHAMGQQGGWPLTMLLAPDGAAIWGGTYFAPRRAHGRPSFTEVLTYFARAWQQQRPALLEQAAKFPSLVGPQAQATASFDNAAAAPWAERLAAAFDPVNGGFRGAPKFPNAPVLDFMLRADRRFGITSARTAVIITLQRMCLGGIYDHLRGGFARYSVDEHWLVPHFEKMLYDNAQLIDLLTRAWLVTGDDLFKARVAETVDWIAAEMTASDGAFYASLDADSEGVEGRFYLWQRDEIVSLLGSEAATEFCRLYDVTPQGNFRDEGTGTPANILNRLQSGPSDSGGEDIVAMKARLLAARATRSRPGCDDKILADWNGLMIGALTHAASVFARQDWLALARGAACFVYESMSTSDRSQPPLGHSARAGKIQHPGLATDHVFMLQAALALHEAGAVAPCTGATSWLAWAEQLAAAIDEHFFDPATRKLSQASRGASDVPLRLCPTEDDAIPNPHGPLVEALIQLAAHSGDDRWRRRAERWLEDLAGPLTGQPLRHCGVLAASLYAEHVAEVTLAGHDQEALRTAALATRHDDRIVITKPATDGPAQAIVCIGQTCALPVTDARAMLELIAAPRRA
ncbi:MAG: thioredoxin domain-containing protein [Hyphomicrobiales bacterium]|nr:thioredoxin domain-containing protein [Hyphomicrobiales bacterium]